MMLKIQNPKVMEMIDKYNKIKIVANKVYDEYVKQVNDKKIIEGLNYYKRYDNQNPKISESSMRECNYEIEKIVKLTPNEHYLFYDAFRDGLGNANLKLIPHYLEHIKKQIILKNDETYQLIEMYKEISNLPIQEYEF